MTISWIRSDLTYVGVNQLLSDLCHVPQQDFVDKQVGFYTNEKLFIEFVKELFAEATSVKEQELRATIDGEEKWYYIVGRKYQQDTHAVLIGIDITEQKLTQNRLILQDKLATLGEMSASIIHELSNPLMVIMGLANRLYRTEVSKDISERVHDTAEKIEKEAMRLGKIISTLRNFSRDTSRDEMTEVKMRDVIDDALSIWKERYGRSPIKVSISCPNQISVLASDMELSQVVLNLLVNATHAIEELSDQWIRIDVQEIGENVRIHITDSGNGIPEVVAKRLFEPFFSTKEKGKGTGLGLAICLKIVAKHHGSLVLDRDHHHTRFVILLPKFVEAAVCKLA